RQQELFAQLEVLYVRAGELVGDLRSDIAKQQVTLLCEKHVHALVEIVRLDIDTVVPQERTEIGVPRGAEGDAQRVLGGNDDAVAIAGTFPHVRAQRLDLTQ